MSRPLMYPTKGVRDRYQVQDLVGRGAFGDVWACVDKETGRHVACKIVDRVDLCMQEDLRGEVSALERLQERGGHQGIIGLVEVLEHRSKVQIITELCAGGDLFSLIRKGGPLTEDSARAVFRQLASAVAFCHAHDVMHRDIKPENILLDQCLESSTISLHQYPAAQAKLADFGLSLLLEKETFVRGYRGTKFYAAPEVTKGERYAFPADIWSMGVVLFVMLSGRLPLVGKDGEDLDPRWHDLIGQISTSDDRVLKGVSSRAYSLLKLLLAPDAADRPRPGEVMGHGWMVEGAAGGWNQKPSHHLSRMVSPRGVFEFQPTSPSGSSASTGESLSSISDTTCGSDENETNDSVRLCLRTKDLCDQVQMAMGFSC